MRKPRRCAFEERIHRRHVRCREGERGGHAVAQQFVEEYIGHFVRMRGIGKLRFRREGVVLQPGQEPGRWRADDVRLREVDVHVDEARRKDAPRPMRHIGIGMARRHGGMAAGIEHALAAGAVGGDDQQAVFIENRLAGVVESQEGGAVGFFHRCCGG
jgi:hypothetical protein